MDYCITITRLQKLNVIKNTNKCEMCEMCTHLTMNVKTKDSLSSKIAWHLMKVKYFEVSWACQRTQPEDQTVNYLERKYLMTYNIYICVCVYGGVCLCVCVYLGAFMGVKTCDRFWFETVNTPVCDWWCLPAEHRIAHIVPKKHFLKIFL